MSENIQAVSTENTPNVKLSGKEARILIPSALFTGILYSVCFTGIDIYPQLSFTVFCFAVFILLSFVLKKLGYLSDKKTLLWFIPIGLLAAFNGIFSLSLFSYSNVLFVHLLFAVFVLHATGGRLSMWTFDFVGRILRTMLSNWLVWYSVFDRKYLSAFRVSGKAKKLYGVIIGLMIAFPVVLVLFGLLMSADMVFNFAVSTLYDYLYRQDRSILKHLLPVLLVTIYAIGYIHNANALNRRPPKDSPKEIPFDNTIWITFLACINLLFLGFSVVQFAFLFTGGYMTLPDGIIYSEYAREGFFQLLFVTVINFMALFFITSVLHGEKKSPMVNRLLILLCLFTLVLIISSFYRMSLYIGSYGYTTLRLQVLTFLTMELVLVVITIVYLRALTFSLAKFAIITCFCFYVAVNITGSDYAATKLNVDRFWRQENAVIDVNSVGSDGMTIVNEVYKTEAFIKGEIYKVEGKIWHKNAPTDSMSKVRHEMTPWRIYNKNPWQNRSLITEIGQIGGLSND